MSEKHFDMDIFSFERTPRGIPSATGAEPYFPYAAAWKEFDKLQKTAQGRGPLRVVLRAFEFLMSGVGIYGLHITKAPKLLVVAWGAAGIAEPV
jgi:hypothetical protein